MYFTETAHLRELEKLMCRIPNFHSKGYGLIVMKSQLCICTTDLSSRSELQRAAMSAISYPPFTIRLSQYIKESEMKPITYLSEKHKEIFENSRRKKDRKNYALMAALYLLTADFRLWQIMKRHIEKNQIHFEQVRLNGINEDAYTLYCTAKDLYLGTKHLTVSDLADH